MFSPTIQWYPGHIAKAERQLKEQLKRVDVVLEVRDARIPLASHHPQVAEWIGSKPKISLLNRMDMIPDYLHGEWREAKGMRASLTSKTTSTRFSCSLSCLSALAICPGYHWIVGENMVLIR